MELSEQTQIKLIEDVATTRQSVLDIQKSLENNNRIMTKLLETHDGRLCELERYKNEMIGKISIISVICGAVGWGITAGISYLLGKY